MKTIIVAGALANKPFNGGEAWVRLSWLRGLKDLGFNVYFLEQIAPETCVDMEGKRCGFAYYGNNRKFFWQVVQEFGFENSATLIYNEGERTMGDSLEAVLGICESAEALINISGHLSLKPLMDRIQRKVYIDIDPGFTQFWHHDGNAGARLEGHTDYFTIGENIGRAECPIPTGGIPWRPVRQPVVLDDWPVVRSENPLKFTTVANWRGPFGPITFHGRTLGLKVHEFRKLIRLPSLVNADFELAMNIDPGDAKDRALLEENRWHIVEPWTVSTWPQHFRQYVQGSGAEFSVAQGVYVDTQSGWLSDRTIRYLASGKPVLIQDTGIKRFLPTGEGLVVFSTIDEAVAGVKSIRDNYDRHCVAARRIAEEHFASAVTLGRLMNDLGIAP